MDALKQSKRGRKPTPKVVVLKRFTDLIDKESDKGVSRERIAKEIGCDVSTITKHYNDNQGIDIEFLVKYANYFKVSTDYLLGLSDTPSVDPNVSMICNYTGFDEKVVNLFHELLNLKSLCKNNTIEVNDCSQGEKWWYNILMKGMTEGDKEHWSDSIEETVDYTEFKDIYLSEVILDIRSIINDYLTSREFSVFLTNCLSYKIRSMELSEAKNKIDNNNLDGSIDAEQIARAASNYENINDSQLGASVRSIYSFLNKYSVLSSKE